MTACRHDKHNTLASTPTCSLILAATTFLPAVAPTGCRMQCSLSGGVPSPFHLTLRGLLAHTAMTTTSTLPPPSFCSPGPAAVDDADHHSATSWPADDDNIPDSRFLLSHLGDAEDTDAPSAVPNAPSDNFKTSTSPRTP